MSGEELFSGINFNNTLEEIDIPLSTETAVKGTEDSEIKTKTKPKKQEVLEDEDDGLIEIPDVYNEPEEEETQETEKKPSDSNVKSNTSSPSPFEPFAKALYEEGIFSHYDEAEFKKLAEETDEVEALFELTRRNIAAEVQAYKDSVDEDYKAFIEAREKGIDLNEYAKASKNIRKYGSIKEDSLEDNEELQKSLIKDYLRNKGFDEDEINDTIESYEDTAKLAGKSKIALKNLIKSENERVLKLEEDAKNADLQFKEEVKKQKQDLQKIITDTEQIIPDVKLTKNEKNKLFELITAPVAKDTDGNLVNAIMKKRLENPLRYAMLEAYYHSIGLFDEKFDKLTKKAKSDSIKKLTEVLSTEGFISGKPVTSSKAIDPDYEDAWSRLKI